MTRLIDPFDQRQLPETLGPYFDRTTDIRFHSLGPAGDSASSRLNMWDTETHFYENNAEADVGFLAGLFKGTGETVEKGVIQESKHYRIEQKDGAPTVEIGVAVRLSVASSKVSGSFALSVPNLTAAAQLGAAHTRVGIYVIGYGGPLGDIVPAPADLKVENFANFVQAFDLIQKRVFGDGGERYYNPELLGVRSE
ncbi:MAG: hypothetical protein AAGB04_27575 [Pseudomonadota bacterium]